MQGFMILAIIDTEKDFTGHEMKFRQSQWSVKCRIRVMGHGACLKIMSRTVTMQGFLILAIIGNEKDTLVFYLTQNYDKVNGA